MLVPSTAFQNPVEEVRIDEEMALGRVVLQLTCKEIGPTSNSAQIKLSGDLSEVLRFDGMSNLEIARRIDFETLPESEREFNVTATCSNRYNQTDIITFTVVINNVDDNPFQLNTNIIFCSSVKM